MRTAELLDAAPAAVPVPPRRSDRFSELDSLRGLAAVSVMLWHFLLIFPIIQAPTFNQPGDTWLNLFKYTPLAILYGGTDAVMLFFVLSGFVLSLPYHRGRAPSYPAFVIKRICRIYVPYLVAVAVGAVLLVTLGTRRPAGLSPWFQLTWATPLSPNMLLSHITLLGNFNSGAIDPVLWSLVYEMRISLLFPLLVAVVVLLRWQWSLVVALGLCFLAPILAHHTQHLLYGTTYYVQTDYLQTLSYALLFVCGILLAQHYEALREWYRASKWPIRLGCVVVGILLYGERHLFPQFTSLHTHSFVTDTANAAGASLLIIAVLGSARTTRFLRQGPLVYLGRISYSLYLLHALVLLSLVRLLYGTLPVGVLLLLCGVIAILVASVSYYLVEVPSMALGRYLSALPLLSGRREVPGTHHPAEPDVMLPGTDVQQPAP